MVGGNGKTNSCDLEKHTAPLLERRKRNTLRMQLMSSFGDSGPLLISTWCQSGPRQKLCIM